MKLIIDLPERVVTAIQNGEDYRYDIHTAIAQGIPYKPKDEFTRRELESWLYAIAINNTQNELGSSCEEIISRLDGFERYVSDMRKGR